MTRELPLVLTLDISGQPHRWCTYQDSAYYYAKDLVAWDMGAVEFDLHGGTSRMTGEQTIMTINTIIAIRGQALAKTAHRHAAPPLTNRALFRRDHNMCAYCGSQFSAGRLTRDHVHPVSRKGADIWTNVVTACGSCNKRKNDKTPEEAYMQLMYVPYAPCRSEYLILMNRRILGDQMDFLLKSVKNKNSRIHLLN